MYARKETTEKMWDLFAAEAEEEKKRKKEEKKSNF